MVQSEFVPSYKSSSHWHLSAPVLTNVNVNADDALYFIAWGWKAYAMV